MKSFELRRQFLDYFHKKQHQIIQSSPLVPLGDDSILFTTAGMVQFKPLFSGQQKLPYPRATSCQKCLRTTDLEQVGRSIRHHTFFEMLGNFSFGDYFKKEAIEMAWEFSVDVLGLDVNRIYISVFHDDNDAFYLWRDHIGIPEKKIVKLGRKDNFWGPAGSTGACGPCSEMYYDLGKSFTSNPKAENFTQDENRYIEYWNLVFNEFNMNHQGQYESLPYSGIDTGMGLERLAMISQDVLSVYETDLFDAVIQKIEHITGISYKTGTMQPAFRIIADHLRAVSFLLVENILPSNEGRGYVIRRILRRAIRYGHKLGIHNVFLSSLMPCLADAMQSNYPELKTNVSKISAVLNEEEQSFLVTLKDGSRYLQHLIDSLKGNMKQIPAKEAFKLYDSMGFHLDMTQEIAKEHGLFVDKQEFDLLLEKQKKQSRQSRKLAMEDKFSHLLSSLKTVYVGEQHSVYESDVVVLMLKNNEDYNNVDSVKCSNEVIVVVKESPFYAEGGGQIGDIGYIEHNTTKIQINDTQKQKNTILHYGHVIHGDLKIADTVTLKVVDQKKKEIAKNHTATHLLHYVLRKHLGESARQMGSFLNEEKLRFDFSYPKALSKQQISLIEREVNAMIYQNIPNKMRWMQKTLALESGAQAFFGDKYDDEVRTILFGDSFELCGGTHVNATGEIGCFKIISEASVAKGIRRIEAITGPKAVQLYQQCFMYVHELLKHMNVSLYDISPERIVEVFDRLKQLEKENERLNKLIAHDQFQKIIDENKHPLAENGYYISLILSGKKMEDLRYVHQFIRKQYPRFLMFLASIDNQQVYWILGRSKNYHQFDAKQLLDNVLSSIPGKGGGNTLLAQGVSSTVTETEHSLKKRLTKIQKNIYESIL